MTHPVDAHIAEARAAIATMIAAARAARHAHARAELLRHMRTTAAKMVEKPLDEAVAKVSHEWMAAWSLDSGAYPDLAADVTDFTRAFCRDARGSDAATQAEVGRTIAALEAGFERIGTTLSDQMAFRSECAHGWWNLVAPPPPGQSAPGRVLPEPRPGEPFWTAGARPHCGGGEAEG